ncbi:hypothetical protein DLR63_06435 [Vibrio tarriae]|nr:hypothetical protein DLR63_06435 [Vibrio tarriae]
MLGEFVHPNHRALVYAHENELTCRLLAAPNSFGIGFCICGTMSIFSFHKYCSHDRHYAMMCAMHSVRKIHQVRF